MATLFPIKVDEDETSQIIKNVLFDDQEELDVILDEFIHLTEKSITDEDDDDVDASDDDDDDDDDDNDDNDEDDVEASDDDEDDDDDDDDDDNEEDDDDDDDSEDNEDEQVERNHISVDTVKSHEPQTWNLDQFIPVVKKEAAIKAPPEPVSSSASNYLVQIDLSKLKRIPSLKKSAISTAKALKHEADAEKDKTLQALKYLESAMYFVLHGHELESSRTMDEHTFYIETLPLFKHALRISMPNQENLDNMTNLKVHTLCVRCISLLHMKLYKLKERELHEFNKTIDQNQPVPLPDGLLGVKPKFLNAYRKQLAIFSNLRCANDYWQRADQYCEQHPAVRIFFTTIESNVGALTQISSIPKLMENVKCGLKLLRS